MANSKDPNRYPSYFWQILQAFDRGELREFHCPVSGEGGSAFAAKTLASRWSSFGTALRGTGLELTHAKIVLRNTGRGSSTVIFALRDVDPQALAAEAALAAQLGTAASTPVAAQAPAAAASASPAPANPMQDALTRLGYGDGSAGGE